MHTPLIVGDLGNSSLQLADFPTVREPNSDVLPRPDRTFHASWDDLEFARIAAWIEKEHGPRTKIAWRLGSVNRRALKRLVNWIEARNESVRVVNYSDFRMPINVKYPERVGIDRIASAFAANALRAPHQAAIVVDAGTAITIDCVTASGQFIGGVIAPGMLLGIDALCANTDLLPLTRLDSIPPLIGGDTNQAIRAGVYWLTTQGINGLIDRLRTELASPCAVFGTGGSMPNLLPNLHDRLQHVPHLVLCGLALSES